MLKSDAIFVKSYVKEYLINNFGEDIKIPEDNFIMAAFRICAQRKKKMKDKVLLERKQSKSFGDDSLVPIYLTLSQHTYINYGYYLTPTEEMAFRSFLEKMVKEKLDTAYDITKEINTDHSVSDIIDIFRSMSRVSEESFSMDAVRKYIYRRNKRNRPKPIEGPTLFNHGTSSNTAHSS